VRTYPQNYQSINDWKKGSSGRVLPMKYEALNSNSSIAKIIIFIE
jgi:hypothetical protein